MSEKKPTKKEISANAAVTEKMINTTKEIMKITGATFFEDDGEYGYELNEEISTTEDFEIIRAKTPYLAVLGLNKWFFDGKVMEK